MNPPVLLRSFWSNASLVRYSNPSMLVLVALVVAQGWPLDPPVMAGDARWQGKQGEVLRITVPVTGNPKEVRGQFLNRPILFYPAGGRTYESLLGLDLQAKPGVHELTVNISFDNNVDHQVIPIHIKKETYPEQQLKLPKNMVDLDKKTLARVREGDQGGQSGLWLTRASTFLGRVVYRTGEGSGVGTVWESARDQWTTQTTP